MEFTNFNVNLEEKTITLVTPYREKNPVIKCKSIGELIKEINRFSNYLLIESGLHPYEKALFSCDDGCISVYEGYHKHQNWNGFACPYFELGVSKQMAKIMNDLDMSTKYDETKDCFIIVDNIDDEPYEIFGEDIIFEGDTKHVYALGNCFWTWIIISEDKVKKDGYLFIVRQSL